MITISQLWMGWTTLFDLMISNVSQKGSSLIRSFLYVKNYFFKAKAIKKFQVNFRWLLQKRSICVIYCHIGREQKGNKKPRSLDEKTGFKRAGPTRLELATSGLTGKRPTFHTPVTTNI